MECLLVLAALFVAFSNGANDNFKGFATVWGSDTLHYRAALTLATLATVAGSLASLLLADTLVQQFSGKGLVPDAVASTPLFILSVASGTAVTVALATRLGLPVSTTHALIGGLIGAGLGQSDSGVRFMQLADSFLLPLLLSPLLAAALGVLAYRLLRLAPVQKDCACLVLAAPTLLTGNGHALLGSSIVAPRIVLAQESACDRLDASARVSVSRSLDRLHIGSAMLICFARGLNDTPKLTALLLAARLFHAQAAIVAIGLVMALGGVLLARRVAQTMSRDVSRMDHAQGLAANLITASLVLLASKFGLPVSTTHVALGAIAGVGASANTLNRRALRNVLLSWLATLPLALLLAFVALHLLRALA